MSYYLLAFRSRFLLQNLPDFLSCFVYYYVIKNYTLHNYLFTDMNEEILFPIPNLATPLRVD